MAADFLAEGLGVTEVVATPHEGEVQNFRDLFGAPGSDWLQTGRIAERRGQPWPAHGLVRLKRVPPYVRGPAEVERVFSQCWGELSRKATLSSVSITIVLEPAYGRLVGLGLEGIPAILTHLHEFPSIGFLALNAIVGEDMAAGASDITSAVDSWRAWGVGVGYLE